MLFASFIRWWYGPGWLGTILATRRRLGDLARNFSLGILLKTLFAPWKQLDASSGQNRGLDAKFRAWLDKSISRFIGFLVRSATLWAAFFGLVFLLLGRMAWILIWPCLPLAVPILLALSLGLLS